jgi:hypothetical protein
MGNVFWSTSRRRVPRAFATSGGGRTNLSDAPDRGREKEVR